jgi:phosphoglycerate-specific signal transduction histidine kinase
MTDLIQQLRERIAELEEEIRQLREDMRHGDSAFVGILSRQQGALLRGICKRTPATYAYLDNITEDHGKYNRYEGEMHITLRTRVAVWKLRNKLRDYGIKINVLRGVGYYLDDDNKAKLKLLMEKK